MSSKSKLPPLLMFIPRYIDGSGDITELVTTEGAALRDYRGIRSVRAALCRQHAVDYTALRSICREMCGPGVTPLLLAPGYTLVPVKTREAMFSGDPCYGYVNLALVTAVQPLNEGKYRAEIKTAVKNIGVKTLTSAGTVKQNLRRAELLQRCHWPGDISHRLQRQELLKLILKTINLN
ncbi:hypothetical protein JOC37_001133 [Desulfohalotomaculum tongense]|uniref:hypothetical protein n=1 Tax=Desulforadius tongensis TaxID=1216062 RepID=UPI00195E6871|nr:hypothetical protein [Desulforadius tongensis]MBM7854755.1 hypothetical protein [Desulforadius tongensis]